MINENTEGFSATKASKTASGLGYRKLTALGYKRQRNIQRAKVGNMDKPVTQIIGVASGKGGVGKSTVAVNLAKTLSDAGARVGLLDADIHGPSIPTLLGTQGQKPAMDGELMVPIEYNGLKTMSIGYLVESKQALVWRGPMLSKAISQFCTDVKWGELDYLFVDLPPGTGDIHLSLVQTVPLDGAVIVSTPQEVALADARRGVNMFKLESINVPVIGIIENMAWFTPAELPENKYYIFGKEGAKNLASDLGVPFLGEIPLVQSIREAGDAGRPAALQVASPIQNSFEELTKNVVQEVVRRNTALPPTEAIKITTMAGCSAVNE